MAQDFQVFFHADVHFSIRKNNVPNYLTIALLQVYQVKVDARLFPLLLQCWHDSYLPSYIDLKNFSVTIFFFCATMTSRIE
ncbi:hypothetical protein GE061_007592 [Apolygus lucorum]|uniref:Uncharacterized protein n=1 Tax=Apolygus lucorum TaxID=248454 RepID=A0A8S9WUQ8_APOLU|nr:hypothetical protein GE061_007592 [Apolygus lucorum]